MAGETAKWESELWHFVSQGNGMHCPIKDRCDVYRNGSWCASDHPEKIVQLIDRKRVRPSNYTFMENCKCGEIFYLVARLADTYLKLGKVSYPPVPSELISVFDRHNKIEVHELPLKTCHGGIWHIEDRWIIQLRKEDTSAMKRFVLFHEAFHMLAHHKAEPVFKKRGVLQGSFNELLADYFATSILLPNEWVIRKWTEVHDLDRVAKTFHAPRPLTYLRLKRLGFV